MVEMLKKYFLENSPEVIKSEWEKIEQLGFMGPNAFEYIQFLDDHYKLYLPEVCLSKQIKIPENMTPNFTGSFFLRNIVV